MIFVVKYLYCTVFNSFKSHQSMQITIRTTAYAAQVMRKRYGNNFKVNNSHHLFLIRILRSDGGHSPKFRAEVNSSFDCSLPRDIYRSIGTRLGSVGKMLHEYWVEQLNEFILAKMEEGVSITEAVDNWYQKYDLDDDILKIDTVKKNFLRYREKLKKCQSNVRSDIKTVKIEKKDARFSPVFVLERFASFFVPQKEVFNGILRYFEVEGAKNLLCVDSTKFLYIKRLLCFFLKKGTRLSNLKIAKALNVSEAWVRYNLDKLNLEDSIVLGDIVKILETLEHGSNKHR